MKQRILALPLLLLLSPLLWAADNAHKDAQNLLLVAREAANIQAVATSPSGPADINVDIRPGSINARQRTAISDASYMVDRVAIQLAIADDAGLAREWTATKANVEASIQLLVRNLPRPGKIRCGNQFTKSDAAARLAALHCANNRGFMHCAAAGDLYEQATEQLDRCLISR